MAMAPTGIITFTADERAAINTELHQIITDFVPTDFQGSADTFYITVKYNESHPDATINGATVQDILADPTLNPTGV